MSAGSESVPDIPPGLSVVIPAYNEERLITGCLRSLADAARPFEADNLGVEWIVCDNASTDRTAPLAAAAGARVVSEPVRQIARARNRGAAAARGEWLLFFDADSVASPGLFADLRAAMRDTSCLGGGAPVRLEATRRYGHVLAAVWNLVSRLTRWAPGSFLFCRAEAFRQVDGFNEDLFVSEEIDLSRRLKVLARQRRQRWVILRGHPVVTSARKLELYSPREAMAFTWRFLRAPRRVARDRQACPIWYDGRR